MKKITLYRIHYGFCFLYDSVQSVKDWSDEIHVVVSEESWYKNKTVTYLGKETELVFPIGDNKKEVMEKLKGDVIFHTMEFDTPRNQFATMIKKLGFENDLVLTLEPDMIFPEDFTAKELQDEMTSSVITCRQIEYWKNKEWRIPQRARPGPVLINNPKHISTGFNNVPIGEKCQTSIRLTDNMGFCFPQDVMLYKHLLAIGFSKQIGDSPPNEMWYEDKWLNWTPDKINLEISKGHEHNIKKAIKV